MTITLYYAFPSRAVKVRWLLEELGVPYQLTRFDLAAGEHQTSAYRKIHPLAQVPALVDGPTTLFEAGAICVYLADRYRDIPLAPAIDAPDRAVYLQWVFFSIDSLETPFLDWVKTGNETSKDRFLASARVLDEVLGDRPYLLGDFSAADCLVGSPLGWARKMGRLDDVPQLLAYHRRLVARPASKRSRYD